MHTPSSYPGFPVLVLAAALSCAALSACEAQGARAASCRLPHVDAAPTLGSQPASLLVRDGEPAMFAITGVTGCSALAVDFQWQRNGIDIPGADQPYLIIAQATLADDGARYTLVARNAAGSTVSRPGVLAVVRAETELPWR